MLRILFIAFTFIITFVHSQSSWTIGQPIPPFNNIIATAHAVLRPFNVSTLNKNTALSGSVLFQQDGNSKLTRITVRISGLTPQAGGYGLHIHTYGDISNPPTSLSSHFNPFNVSHGCGMGKVRHEGDVGVILNSTSSVSNPMEYLLYSELLDLGVNGPSTKDGIIGRSVVIHASPDPCIDSTYGYIIGMGVIGIGNMLNNQAIQDPFMMTTVAYAQMNDMNGISYGGFFISQPDIEYIRITGYISRYGFIPGSQHGLSIHQYGDITNQTSIGGRWNGDNGNIGTITADASGNINIILQSPSTSTLSVNIPSSGLIGRTLAIHATPDTDGPAILYGVIGLSSVTIPEAPTSATTALPPTTAATPTTVTSTTTPPITTTTSIVPSTIPTTPNQTQTATQTPTGVSNPTPTSTPTTPAPATATPTTPTPEPDPTPAYSITPTTPPPSGPWTPGKPIPPFNNITATAIVMLQPVNPSVANKNVQLKGSVLFEQDSVSRLTRVTVRIAGLVGQSGGYGLHIHTYGDLYAPATSSGPHFNPFNVAHGCGLGNVRHVGDVGSILDTKTTLTPDSNGFITQVLYSELLDLGVFGPATNDSIIGRAVVIHALNDPCNANSNGAYLASGIIGLGQSNTTFMNQASQDVFPPSIMGYARIINSTGVEMGSLLFRNTNGRVRITGTVSGFTPNMQHGWHIHTYGDISSPAASGPHFNPLRRLHGLPPNPNREAGDLGNVMSDSNGIVTVDTDMGTELITLYQQSNGILGRTLTFHALQDDGVAFGARMLYGVIGLANPTVDHGVGWTSGQSIPPFNNITATAVVLLQPFQPSIANKNAQLTGSVLFEQDGVSRLTRVTVRIAGLVGQPGGYGLHVHTYGDQYSLPSSMGPHYNPFNVSHSCGMGNVRHVGDVGSILDSNTVLTPDANGFITQVLYSELLDLGVFRSLGDDSIIGRAVVIHAFNDPCNANSNGPYLASGVIGLGPSNMNFTNQATQDAFSEEIMGYARIINSTGVEVGSVLFLNDNGNLRIVGKISGFIPNSQHGWHIHTYGDISSPAASGPHFNPLRQPHGLPPNPNREAGDLGNVMSDANGIINVDTSMGTELVTLYQQSNGIVGRTLTFHALQDDGVAFGARMAYGVIGLANPTFDHGIQPIILFSNITATAIVMLQPFQPSIENKNAQLSGSVLFEQDSTAHLTRVTVRIAGLVGQPGGYGLHIHTYGDQYSLPSSMGPHFNPFNVAHGCGLGNVRHVGDVGSILDSNTVLVPDSNGFITQVLYSELLDFGLDSTATNDSIIGRAVVIHALNDPCNANSNGPYLATGVIGLGPSTTTFINQARQDEMNDDTMGYARIINASGVDMGAVLFRNNNGRVRITGSISGFTPNTQHGWHIHTYGDISSPAASGPHFNPLRRPHGLPPNPNREAGDLGNVMSDSNGVINVDTMVGTELVTLYQQSNGIVGRTLTFHALQDDGVAFGARMAYGVIGLANPTIDHTTMIIPPTTSTFTILSTDMGYMIQGYNGYNPSISISRNQLITFDLTRVTATYPMYILLHAMKNDTFHTTSIMMDAIDTTYIPMNQHYGSILSFTIPPTVTTLVYQSGNGEYYGNIIISEPPLSSSSTGDGTGLLNGDLSSDDGFSTMIQQLAIYFTVAVVGLVVIIFCCVFMIRHRREQQSRKVTMVGLQMDTQHPSQHGDKSASHEMTSIVVDMDKENQQPMNTQVLRSSADEGHHHYIKPIPPPPPSPPQQVISHPMGKFYSTRHHPTPTTSPISSNSTYFVQ